MLRTFVISILLLATWSWGRSARGETAGPEPAALEERSESIAPADIQLAESFAAFVSGAERAARQDGEDRAACQGEACFFSDQLVQAGWWFSTLRGSPAKTAQFQDLEPSPFWSVESLTSDGRRTWGFSADGLDREATDVLLRTYSPAAAAGVQYQRYIRHVEADRLLNFAQPVPEHAHPGSDPSPNGQYLAEDLHVGQDYAIRIQQLRADMAGKLTEQTRWGLNVWSMRKSGERQALGLSNAYDVPQIAGNCEACHVLSQRQQIDWQTVEVEPVVESRHGPITVSFSLPIRAFSQDDQYLTRLYNPPPANYGGQAIPPQLGSESYPAGAEYPYAMVPDNLTQIRKLKIGVDLAEGRYLYALLHQGSTDNKSRNIRRNFSGVDLRLTDRTHPGLTWTGYVKRVEQDNPLPAERIGGELLEFDRYDETTVDCTEDISREYGGCGCDPLPSSCVLGQDGVSDFFASDALADPVDYARTTLGWNVRWKPFRHDRSWKRGLTCYGRYEFRLLQRGDAVFESAVAPGETVVFDQTETGRHLLQWGLSQRWSTTLDSFLRYRTWFESDPLYGARESNGITNSMLPTHVDVIEIGGTWSPADWFMASGTFAFENRLHESGVADFDEQDYPWTSTLWYRPTERLVISAGCAWNSNRIRQTIVLGDDLADGAPYAPAAEVWGYGGRHQVYSLGSVYRWSLRWRLRGDVQYVLGEQGIDSTVFDSRHDWPAIAEVVRNDRRWLRASIGLDHALRRRTTGYVRYTFLDYGDAVEAANSGTAHLLLAGLSSEY